MEDDVPLNLQEDAEGGLMMWLVGDLRVKRWASNRPAYWLEIQARSEIYFSESPSTGKHTLLQQDFRARRDLLRILEWPHLKIQWFQQLGDVTDDLISQLFLALKSMRLQSLFISRVL